jgi:hypothetical protein
VTVAVLHPRLGSKKEKSSHHLLKAVRAHGNIVLREPSEGIKKMWKNNK